MLDLIPSGLKADSGSQPPLANKGHQSVATSSEAAPLKDIKNSTANEIESQMLILELDIGYDCSKYKIVFV